MGMLALANAVADLTATTGAGSLTLAGTPFNVGPGLQSFATAYGTGTVTNIPYSIRDQLTGSELEVGLGTLSGGNTLTRNYILTSSAGSNAVTLAAGNKIVCVTFPARFLAPQMRSPTPLAAAAGSSVNLTTDGNTRNASQVYGPANGLITLPGDSGNFRVNITAKGSSGGGSWGAEYFVRYLNQGGAVTLDPYGPQLVGGQTTGLGTAASLNFSLTAAASGPEIVLTVNNLTGDASETWNVIAGIYQVSGQ